MIVSLEDADAIVAGELDDLVLPDAISIGTVCAIQIKTGQRAKCHVEIVERWPHAKSGWVHRFRLVPRPHEGHFLHRNPGAGRADYTSSPGQAMREEGEAPRTKDDLDRLRHISRVQTLKDREERRIVQKSLPLEKRVVAYQHEAKHRRIDIRQETRLMRYMLAQGREAHAAQQAERIEAKLDHDLDRAA